MMAMDDSKPELEDIGTGIVEVFKEFGIEAITAGEFDPGEVITDRILSEIRNPRVPHCRPDARTPERVLRGRARARPDKRVMSGAERGHEAALRPVAPQLPGIRERRWSERVVAQTVGGDHEQKNSDVTLEQDRGSIATPTGKGNHVMNSDAKFRSVHRHGIRVCASALTG